MPTFRVDILAIDYAVKDLRSVIMSFGDILPQFLELQQFAPATGDPNCEAAFSGFVQQWGSEIVSAAGSLVALSNNLLAAANDYANTEAAIADVDVSYFNVDTL